jgi:nucleoside-diphosphate-sugar epimerase
MKKILVTGATGFIGNHVIQELLKENFHVIASSSNEGRAKEMTWFPSVTYIPLDLDNTVGIKNVFEYFQQPDAVIHLSWEGLQNYKSHVHLDINLPRQIAFLHSLIETGARDITVTGTCFEYGMKEGCLDESMAAQPANPYAQAKEHLRQYLQNLQNQTTFELKWIRLFYMFGTGQNPNSLFSQLDKALANGATEFNMSGGEQLRDYLPVEKVAKYIVKIALQHKVTGVINCCSGRPVSVKELVNSYLRSKKASIKLNLGFYPYPDYEPMAFWGSNSKLKTILNDE